VNPFVDSSSFGLSLLAIAAGYAIGSIPFGYLIARWVKGIDIRTVGSGNLGATNVGRTLGFRYFVIVLVLDMLKGLVPTAAFPWLVGKVAGAVPADLAVLVAVAAILGHTFPIYLKFRGGKGVSTSLGCVLALDAVSCAVAAVVFAGVLIVTRYVSLASLLGGVGFAVAHLVREPEPLGRDRLALSVFSIAVPVLLIVRHHKNLARIWAGTESRADLRWRRRPTGPPQPSGRVALWVIGALVVLAASIALGGTWFFHQASTSSALSAGPWMLREVDRTITSQERADRVAFAPKSSRFVVTCPRYDRVIVYNVTAQKKLEVVREIELSGRPVAVAALPNRFLVLERPPGDERHVQPGWWDAFDLDGNTVSDRHRTGYYPDDMAVSPDGKNLFVISSGRGEGDPKKPLPTLEVVGLDRDASPNGVVSRLEFDANDDLDRLALAASGRAAAVLLPRTRQTAAIDLTVPESPRLIGRSPVGRSDAPYVSCSRDDDWIMMPVIAHCAAVAIERPRNPGETGSLRQGSTLSRPDFLLCTRQDESALEVIQNSPRCSLGRLPLRGSFNLGHTRPTALAYSPEIGFLAVVTRSGAIHLIEVSPRGVTEIPARPQVAAGRETSGLKR
jgi:glycerol-3-phosphate acyltransferase PlsY